MVVSNLNDDHLVKLFDESQFLVWGIEDKWHVVGTRHFAFRIDVLVMEEDEDAWPLASWLEETFGRIPKSGETFVFNHGSIKTDVHFAKQMLDKYFTNISKNEGKTTPFLYAIGSFRYRWIKFPNGNVFVNDEYLSILYDTENEPAFSDGQKTPLYMHGGDFMILPIKNMDNKVTTDELEGFAEMLKSEGINVN